MLASFFSLKMLIVTTFTNLEPFRNINIWSIILQEERNPRENWAANVASSFCSKSKVRQIGRSRNVEKYAAWGSHSLRWSSFKAQKSLFCVSFSTCILFEPLFFSRLNRPARSSCLVLLFPPPPPLHILVVLWTLPWGVFVSSCKLWFFSSLIRVHNFVSNFLGAVSV